MANTHISVIFAITATLALSACAEQPAMTPQYQSAQQVAVLEKIQSRCSAYIGGFGDARELRNSLNTVMERAAKVGSTQDDFQQAKAFVENRFSLMEAFSGVQDACGEFIGIAVRDSKS